MKQSKLWNVKNVVLMGASGALAAVLMVSESPLPFITSSFYGLDLSEVPVLMGIFSIGPLAGVVIGLVKVLVKLSIKSTSIGFVGELASFCFGCFMILPTGWIYKVNRTKKGAIIGMAVDTVSMAVVGIVGSALVMLPFYSNSTPLDAIIAAGATINPAISSVRTSAMICVGPLNLIKGFVVPLITALVYKRISIIIRMFHPLRKKQVKEQA